MIPRFVINNINSVLLDKLTGMDFVLQEKPIPVNILVIGSNLLKAPVPEKNPLLKVLNGGTDEDAILKLAEMQKKWNNNTVKRELILGEPANGKVIVTPYGVMIDSCILEIELFQRTYKQMNGLKSEFVVSHQPVINPMRPFLTVGCADYSLNDIHTILVTYHELLLLSH